MPTAPRLTFRPLLLTLPLALVGLVNAPDAAALPLLGVASLTGTSDFSGLGGLLEDGLAANVLGGLGSGFAYAGGSTYLALPDRGPNKLVWNAGLDNTTSFVSRFDTVTMTFTNTPSGSLPFTLTPTLTGTTLLYSSTPLNYGTAPVPSINTANRYYFTGRSDAFGAGSSLASTDARLDPEGIRVSNDGLSVFVSDEYGPYVYQFDRTTGERVRTFDLPSSYGIANKNSLGATEISGNATSGRVTNKGMEGLAISPDGSTLIGFMQSPLAQDGGDNGSGENGRYNRLVRIDVATGATHEYVYDNQIAGANYNSSEIIAINDHEFLVLERDGRGLGAGNAAAMKGVFKIDLAGATELPPGASGAATLASYAVSKTTFIDLRAALLALGLTDAQIPSKLEGLAFGQDVVIGGVTKHTLFVSNDNDFAPTDCVAGYCNTNLFYAFGFDANDLPTYQPQQFANVNVPVPLPGTAWLLTGGLGVLGAAVRRRKA